MFAITHKLNKRELRFFTLYDACEKICRLVNKYNLPLKFEWDGDDIPIILYVKPNSKIEEIEDQYKSKLEYETLSPLQKFLRT
jgi:hypothetical protein